jgi:adenosylcobinamide-phosphate synthase
MNWIPARLSVPIIAAVAAVLPGGSLRKAISIGWSQHGVLPSPNSGWSEAAAAGALRRRLVGPIWSGGRQVTDVWLGDPGDPPLETARDYARGSLLVALSGVVAAVLAAGAIVIRA